MTLEQKLSVREGILVEIFPSKLISVADSYGLVSPAEAYITVVAVRALKEIFSANVLSDSLVLSKALGKEIIFESLHVGFDDQPELELYRQRFSVKARSRGYERFYLGGYTVLADESVFKLKDEFLPPHSSLRF